MYLKVHVEKTTLYAEQTKAFAKHWKRKLPFMIKQCFNTTTTFLWSKLLRILY